MGWKLHKYTVLGSKNEVSAKRIRDFQKKKMTLNQGVVGFGSKVDEAV